MQLPRTPAAKRRQRSARRVDLGTGDSIRRVGPRGYLQRDVPDQGRALLTQRLTPTGVSGAPCKWGEETECSTTGEADWIVGPGEPPSGIRHGPAEVAPRSSIVFTDRLRAKGEFGQCRVTLVLGEWIGSEMSILTGTGEWQRISTMKIALIPQVRVQYLFL